MTWEQNITCVKTVGTRFNFVIPFLVLRTPDHNISGEETHFGPPLERGAIGQRDGHPEVSVREWLVQGQSQTVAWHGNDLPHLILFLAVPKSRNNQFIDVTPPLCVMSINLWKMK